MTQGQSNVTKITERLWECVTADIFTINNKHYPCIVDFHSKFLAVKQVKGFSADNLIIFSEYVLPSKIVADVGTNFDSENIENFCKKLSMQHAV